MNVLGLPQIKLEYDKVLNVAAIGSTRHLLTASSAPERLGTVTQSVFYAVST